MKEKISELLNLHQVEFKKCTGDFCDYLIYCLHDKIIINCKTYYDKNFQSYYSLRVKVVYENFDKYEYNCFSCELDKCILFFENIMSFLGVFSEYD